MSFKTWSSAQSALGDHQLGSGSKAAPEAEKSAAQPAKAPAEDESRPAQKS